MLLGEHQQALQHSRRSVLIDPDDTIVVENALRVEQWAGGGSENQVVGQESSCVLRERRRLPRRLLFSGGITLPP